MTHSCAAPPMRCVPGVSSRRWCYASFTLARHRAGPARLHRGAGADHRLRPGDNDPKHHDRHREGTLGEPAGATASPDSADVPTTEPVHRFAEIQTAGATALAHP